MNYTDHFSASYAAARERFRQSALEAGGTLSQHRHPTAVGPQGEALWIDVAHIGRAAPCPQLIVVSGTHGLEGFAGSALQVAWLKTQAAALPQDIGVLLVHGLNPYGFAHGTRTTAQGVDLNRNFIDHTQPAPKNLGYAALHAALVSETWDAHAHDRAEAALADYRARFGDDALFAAFASGQYDFDDGLFFGGFARTWESTVLEATVQQHAAGAASVCVIDLHTGIGDHGLPFMMVFNDDAPALLEQAALWWGRERAIGSRPHGVARPPYQGLVVQGVRDFLPGSLVLMAVIEFGTRGPKAGEVAMRQDLWLRRHGASVPDDARSQIHADLLDSLNPVSYLWRTSVLQTGLGLLQDAVHGLSTSSSSSASL